MKIRRSKPQPGGRRRLPFDQRPIDVNGHRLTYGVIRLNAQQLLEEASSGGGTSWEKGLAHSLLAVLEELERCQDG